MSDQIEYIGKKIKELNGVFFKQSINDKNIYSILLNQMDSLRVSKENLFIFIGEFLMNQNEKNKNNLITFSDVLGVNLINSNATLDESINLVYLTRKSIMDLLEREARENRISISDLFDTIKVIEYLYQLISKTLMNFYNEELSFIKFALDESKQNLQMTLKELADLDRVLNEATIFAFTDREDRISYVNDNFCNLYKYSREELIGQKHDFFASGYHPPSFFRKIWQVIEAGEVWKGEILNQAKDGTKYWLDTTIVPFMDANGKRYRHVSIQYDITEKKRTEDTLRKTEQLSMIGELAAGIAHEIRNPLTTIKGFVQLLTEEEKAHKYADTILEEIERINFIVSEFMVFAKPHTIYFSDCDIKSILRSVIKFLDPEALLKNVTIEYQIPEEEVIISGEKNQLKQVFLNLIKNAIEAMPEGGKIQISIEKTFQNIHVTIKDSGVGMTEEQVKKLGEPFFTTKPTGNGLGLMVSLKIIQNHKGTINVISEPNQGTTFIISFENLKNR
ncbi:ATP-binding protein [Neobacillus terrae]|uniref:ATP-binding protein n=1 Tax=Neobacillus terrae TaxID=3034837 RepID=UPI00140E5E12|nr:ATP-binding protein [Neobacillus terrae]NHM30958.1 PAS domain-containing protein [Neobacillus terrae]